MAKDKAPVIKDFTQALKDLQDVDALGFAVIGAAGVAGFCGVKGPLTSILMGIGGNKLTSDGKPSLLSNPIDSWALFELTGSSWIALFMPMLGQSGTPPQQATAEEKKAWMVQLGNAASNMVEAGLLYQLARNPETMQTLFDMSKEAVKGAVGLGKGVAALAGGV